MTILGAIAVAFTGAVICIVQAEEGRQSPEDEVREAIRRAKLLATASEGFYVDLSTYPFPDHYFDEQGKFSPELYETGRISGIHNIFRRGNPRLIVNPDGITTCTLELGTPESIRFGSTAHRLMVASVAHFKGESSHNAFLDPFGGELRYFVGDTGAHIVSVGPDCVKDVDIAASWGESLQGLSAVCYDPTNGVLSRGDIIVPRP